MQTVIRPTCCGEFPDSICADCPHATDEQRAAGGVAPTFFRSDGASGGTHRCEVCFMPWTGHVAPGNLCPTIKKLPPAPPEEVVVLKPVVAVPPKPRVPCCPSCSQVWDGRRHAKGAEGMHCGTCGQAMVYS